MRMHLRPIRQESVFGQSRSGRSAFFRKVCKPKALLAAKYILIATVTVSAANIVLMSQALKAQTDLGAKNRHVEKVERITQGIVGDNFVYFEGNGWKACVSGEVYVLRPEMEMDTFLIGLQNASPIVFYDNKEIGRVRREIRKKNNESLQLTAYSTKYAFGGIMTFNKNRFGHIMEGVEKYADSAGNGWKLATMNTSDGEMYYFEPQVLFVTHDFILGMNQSNAEAWRCFGDYQNLEPRFKVFFNKAAKNGFDFKAAVRERKEELARKSNKGWFARHWPWVAIPVGYVLLLFAAVAAHDKRRS